MENKLLKLLMLLVAQLKNPKNLLKNHYLVKKKEDKLVENFQDKKSRTKLPPQLMVMATL